LFTCCPPVDLEGHVVGQEGRDDDLRKCGMAAVRGVERRQAHEPVDATLCLQRSVRVLSLDRDRGRLQAGLLARARLQHFRAEPAIGGPAEVHPQQHVRPVLSVRPARPGVDLENRVTGVVLTVEERVFLQASEFALE
jgi:hypothetical protein